MENLPKNQAENGTAPDAIASRVSLEAGLDSLFNDR